MLNCIDSGWKMCSFFLLFCLFIYCFSKKIVMQTYEFMHRKQSERSIRAYTHFVPVIWWDRDRIREPPLFFVHVIINLLCVWSYQMRSWNIHFTSESNALKERNLNRNVIYISTFFSAEIFVRNCSCVLDIIIVVWMLLWLVIMPFVSVHCENKLLKLI